MPSRRRRIRKALLDVHRRATLIVAACLTAALLVSSPQVSDAAETGAIEASHHGVALIVLPARPTTKYDVSLIDQDQALLALQGALDLIVTKSPSSSEKIDDLKMNGKVAIIYDPNFPWKEITTITMAAFISEIPEFLVEEFPDVFSKIAQEDGARIFVSVIGRHGIKHSTSELAGTIVHELAAHGIQHLRGRIEGRRRLDVECEAFLHQLGAFQDFEMDKFSRYMIMFRKQLRNFVCDDFRRYMQKHKPDQIHLWDQLNVDVPRLLDIFDEYVKFEDG